MTVAAPVTMSPGRMPRRASRLSPSNSTNTTPRTLRVASELVAAGAEVRWSGCNPLSTQDDVAAALADDASLMDAAREAGLDVPEGADHIEGSL